MHLKIFTHKGLRLETYEAIDSRLPAQLEGIVRKCFFLALEDPVELQVLPPVECSTARDSKFAYWELQRALNDGNRQFAVAKAMITEVLVEIFRDTEVPKGERFSVRGCIPHMGTIANVQEDLEPLYFDGTKDIESED